MVRTMSAKTQQTVEVKLVCGQLFGAALWAVLSVPTSLEGNNSHSQGQQTISQKLSCGSSRHLVSPRMHRQQNDQTGNFATEPAG